MIGYLPLLDTFPYIQIIDGNMNALRGKNENIKFGLYNLLCRNGEYLTDFSLTTKFQIKEGKLWTYTYPNNAKAKLDYILINKKWINNTPPLKEYLLIRVIVTAKIHLSLCRNKKQTAKITCYDWSLCINSDISNEYTVTFRNKFDIIEKI